MIAILKLLKKFWIKGVLGEIVDAEIHYDRFDPNLSYKTHKETPTLQREVYTI